MARGFTNASRDDNQDLLPLWQYLPVTSKISTVRVGPLGQAYVL